MKNRIYFNYNDVKEEYHKSIKSLLPYHHRFCFCNLKKNDRYINYLIVWFCINQMDLIYISNNALLDKQRTYNKTFSEFPGLQIDDDTGDE